MWTQPSYVSWLAIFKRNLNINTRLYIYIQKNICILYYKYMTWGRNSPGQPLSPILPNVSCLLIFGRLLKTLDIGLTLLNAYSPLTSIFLLLTCREGSFIETEVEILPEFLPNLIFFSHINNSAEIQPSKAVPLPGRDRFTEIAPFYL